MATLDDLKKILRERGGFEAVEAKATDTQIRLEGRVPPNASSHWVIIAATLLKAAGGDWSLDYSKHYFLRQLSSSEKMFYAHRLIFQSPSIAGVIDNIIKVVKGAPHPSRIELQEFPLAGSGSHRDATAGRGAYGVDKAPIGPMNRGAR